MPTHAVVDVPRPCCPRCQGFLLVEHLAYAHDQLYCLNCGWRTCPVIEANRRAPSLYKHDLVEYRIFPQLLAAL